MCAQQPRAFQGGDRRVWPRISARARLRGCPLQSGFRIRAARRNYFGRQSLEMLLATRSDWALGRNCSRALGRAETKTSSATLLVMAKRSPATLTELASSLAGTRKAALPAKVQLALAQPAAASPEGDNWI